MLVKLQSEYSLIAGGNGNAASILEDSLADSYTANISDDPAILAFMQVS